MNGDARRDGESPVPSPPRRPVLALVSAREFYRGLPLVIVARLEASTTIDILDGSDDESSRLVPRPDEYHGFVVRYSFPTTHVYALLFTKTLLPRGGRYRLGGDVNYFSPELNFVAAALEPAAG